MCVCVPTEIVCIHKTKLRVYAKRLWLGFFFFLYFYRVKFQISDDNARKTSTTTTTTNVWVFFQWDFRGLTRN